MWIELHDGARDHPKILKLARDLKIPKAHALGLLSSLWLWTLRMAPDGDLSSFDDDDIEIGAGWDGESGAFIKSAISRRLLDKTENGLICHDWEDYSGSLKAAQRMREYRLRKRDEQLHNGDVTVNNGEKSETNGDVMLRRPNDLNDQKEREDLSARAREDDQESPGESSPLEQWRSGILSWLSVAGCWHHYFESLEDPNLHKPSFEAILRAAQKAKGQTRDVIETAVKNCKADPWVQKNRPSPKYLASNFTKYAQETVNYDQEGPTRSDEDYQELKRKEGEAKNMVEVWSSMGDERLQKEAETELKNIRTQMDAYLKEKP